MAPHTISVAPCYSIWVERRTVAITAGCSPLGRHVGRVVSRLTKEQVIRSYARRIVAAVADEHPLWDRSVCQLPGDTVCPSLSVVY
jgi:hypothetical protein